MKLVFNCQVFVVCDSGYLLILRMMIRNHIKVWCFKKRISWIFLHRENFAFVDLAKLRLGVVYTETGTVGFSSGKNMLTIRAEQNCHTWSQSIQFGIQAVVLVF